MNSVLEKITFLRTWLGVTQPQPQPTKRPVTKTEACLVSAYKVLKWENVSLSLTAFLVLNFLFWFVVHFQIRPFGLFFLILTAGVIADWYLESYGGPIEADLRYIEEVESMKAKLVETLVYMRDLRKESPPLFLLWLIFLCALIYGLAQANLALGLFLVLLLALAIGLMAYCMPSYLKEEWRKLRAISSEDSGEGVVELDDLPPMPSHLDVDRTSSHGGSRRSSRSSSDDESLVHFQLGAVPAVMEVNRDGESFKTARTASSGGALSTSSSDSELYPMLPTSSGGGNIGKLSSSDSEVDSKAMSFSSQHFDGSSSSEEDVQRPSNSQTNVATVTQAISDMVTAATNSRVFADVMGAVANRSRPMPPPAAVQSDSSESDFEVLDYFEGDEKD